MPQLLRPFTPKAAVLVAAGLLIAGTATRAVGTEGQPVIAGAVNTSQGPTVLFNESTSGGCGFSSGFALVTCGGLYAQSDDTDIPLSARHVSPNGVAIQGEASAGGTGVKGFNVGKTGIGVWGQTPGTGSGVYGKATGKGVGVFGDTKNGTGVTARSTNGTALRVAGKVQFSRSGTVTVPASSNAKTVTKAGVTITSMVIATSQQNAPVFVKAAVPSDGSFTIRLTGPAPAGGLEVAYFVLN